jgi:signal transduction histidine kinase
MDGTGGRRTWDASLSDRASEAQSVIDSSNPSQRATLIVLNRSTTAAKLLSGVVHDVNNALQVISGTVELLSSRADLPSTLMPSLERLSRQTARAAAVLADVQQFTRASLTETGRVNLREVAEHSLTLRAFSIKRASLTSRLVASDAEPYYVSGNRAQLQQALINLIINAEQALAGTSGEILVEVLSDGPAVAMRVTDKGTGLTVEPAERAFEPFVTSRDPWESAGLGLWATRAIAAEHGGSATIETSPWGTTATIRLPRA